MHRFGLGLGILLLLTLRIIGKTIGLGNDEKQLVHSSKFIKDYSISNVGLVFKPREIEFYYPFTGSFDCFIAAIVFDNTSEYYRGPHKFYQISKLDRILIPFMQTENIFYKLFVNLGDSHFFKTRKQINSFPCTRMGSYREIVRLDRSLFS